VLATIVVLLTGVAGIAVGLVLGARVRARAELVSRAFTQEWDHLRGVAERERKTLLLDAEVNAREEALALRMAADADFQSRRTVLAERETTLAGRAVLVDAEKRQLEEKRTELSRRDAPLVESENESKRVRNEIAGLRSKARQDLERRANTTSVAVIKSVMEQEIEDARTAAALLVRSAGEGGASMEITRGAKRLMGIACGRLVDRHASDRPQHVVMLPEARGGKPPRIAEEDLKRLEALTAMQIAYTREEDGIRIDGLDGVAREVIRRCLYRMFKRGPMPPEAIEKMTKEFTLELERETFEAGKRAFAILRIPVAHREIVALVGRLIYRTSYSQNQWEHAIESGFLCGMMAYELGLDVKLARRAALMHDIGKALTHQMEGSHALIGADYARRLGELEAVANAIGSHHTEEPFNSVYAHLVTAADAMSGGRPGSRRQSDDNHMAKLSEMERIARGFRGVAEAFAVQGGREVRTYVDAERVSDEGANKLAADIAKAISTEMTFPGQIKITVIREVLAVELAS